MEKPANSVEPGAYSPRNRNLAVGLLLLAVTVAAMTVSFTPPARDGQPFPPLLPAFVFGTSGAVAMFAIGWLWRTVNLELRDPQTKVSDGTRPYALHLTAVGACMLLSGLVASVVVATLVQEGIVTLEGNRAVPDAAQERYRQAVHLLTGSGLAMVGSLFFVANTLWSRGYGEREKEPFDVGNFWGGLALRMGEAQVFMLVIAVVLSQQGALSYEWLPLLGLLFGMYVKTAEALVFGMARRVFKVATSLVDLPDTPESAGGQTKEVTSTPQPAPAPQPEPRLATEDAS